MNNTLPPLPSSLQDKNIAIFHAFFKNRGGAEEVVLGWRDYYNADLFAGALHWDTNNPTKTDGFCKQLFNPKYRFTWLHKDGSIPGIYHIKRQLFMAFSPKRKELLKYDVVLVSGNVSFIQGYLRKNGVKVITYCHTPPRPFADREEEVKKKLPKIARPLFAWFAKRVRRRYKKDIAQSDVLVCNSQNIVNRVQKYFGVTADTYIFPPVKTSNFTFQSIGDYYVTFSRLEEAKRIRLIVDTFANLPDKKLIMCGSGPLAEWVNTQIQERNLENISYEGRVSDERLQELVANCLAGITIPVDEDAGITQIEIMAAGKPVIGVAEGGLLETVINGKTGVLIPSDPTESDLAHAVHSMDVKKAKKMKEDCIAQAQKFSEEVFYTRLNQVIEEVL